MFICQKRFHKFSSEKMQYQYEKVRIYSGKVCRLYEVLPNLSE